jgi:putative FmdB family regulatory protein
MMPHVPRYEFRCRDCAQLGGAAVFEVNRPISEAGEPATCPVGHQDTVKLISALTLTGASRSSGPAPSASSGGCCGGGCGCG